jgi:UDP-N-acetylmuramoylalanine--D-glutamate ligase
MALAQEALKVLGLSEDQIATGLAEYKGMPGRLEFIREINGVKIYNDSNATTPDAVIVALKALSTNKNTILIFGGADKGLDMNPLFTAIKDYAKAVILLSAPGKTSGSDRIAKDFESLDGVTKDTAENLTVALTKALSYAKAGDSIVLSPAFASFGMFKNEYDRGDQFTEIVKSL